MEILSRLLRGALLGMLVVIFVNTSTNVIQPAGAAGTEGDQNFITWLFRKVHEQFGKRGEKLGTKAYTRHVFNADDFKDAAGLATKLKEPTAPAEKYLKEHLSEKTKGLIENSAGASEAADELKKALAEDLNRLIQSGEYIYTPVRFPKLNDDSIKEMVAVRILNKVPDALKDAEGKVDTENLELAKEYWAKYSITDINRQLLEDVFSDYIERVPGGDEIWPKVAPHLKMPYYVLPGLLAGLFFGLLVSGVVLLIKWLRKSRAAGGEEVGGELAEKKLAAGFEVPPAWPVLLAAFGFIFHGYALGLAAFLLADWVRGKRLAWLGRACGVVVSLFWAVGTEMPWPEGWSKIYPDLDRMLKFLFE